MDNIKLLKLYNQFNKVHNQFVAVKRNLVNVDYEEHLYPAEMQVLCVMKSNPEYSLSDISKVLYMTKSAASQLIKKLNAKGFVDKYRDPNNERYNIIKLTEKGQEAVNKFLTNESYTMGQLVRFFSSKSETDIQVIEDFLNEVEDIFNKKL